MALHVRRESKLDVLGQFTALNDVCGCLCQGLFLLGEDFAFITHNNESRFDKSNNCLELMAVCQARMCCAFVAAL